MSTNFYTEMNKCECCGRADKKMIGKRAGGWRFLIKIYRQGAYFNYEQFTEYLRSDKVDNIVDEYGVSYTVDEFLEIVEERSDEREHTDVQNYENPRHAKGIENWGPADAKEGAWT